MSISELCWAPYSRRRALVTTLPNDSSQHTCVCCLEWQGLWSKHLMPFSAARAPEPFLGADVCVCWAELEAPRPPWLQTDGPGEKDTDIFKTSMEKKREHSYKHQDTPLRRQYMCIKWIVLLGMHQSVSVCCTRPEMFKLTLVFCSLKSLSASRSRSSPHLSLCISSTCVSSCVTLLCSVSLRAVRSCRSDDNSSCWERGAQNHSSQPLF